MKGGYRRGLDGTNRKNDYEQKGMKQYPKLQQNRYKKKQ